MIRIAYLSQTNAAEDVRHWSGITYHLYHALSRYADVIPAQISPEQLSRVESIYLRTRARFTGKDYKYGLNPAVLEKLSGRAQETSKRLGADVAIGGQGYFPYWTSPSVKGLIFSDTLYGSKIDFYGNWSRSKMAPQQLRELRRLGKQSIANVDRVFLTSEFAFQRASAELDNDVPTEKRSVVHIGANLMNYTPPIAVEKPLPPPLHLLWVGVDWKRKGGLQTLGVVDQLLKRGIDTTLHVVGCTPPVAHDHMVVHGFLRKWIPDEFKQITDLYQLCHIFIFPTQADMCSAVLAEAAAFHMPGVANRIGGLSDLFNDDEIKFTNPETFVADAVEAIVDLLQTNQLTQLGEKAYRRYQEYLNWDVIAQRMIKEIEALG